MWCDVSTPVGAGGNSTCVDCYFHLRPIDGDLKCTPLAQHMAQQHMWISPDKSAKFAFKFNAMNEIIKCIELIHTIFPYFLIKSSIIQSSLIPLKMYLLQ